MSAQLNDYNRPYFFGVWSNNAGIDDNGEFATNSPYDSFPVNLKSPQSVTEILNNSEIFYTDDSKNMGGVYQLKEDNTGDYTYENEDWVQKIDGDYKILGSEDGSKNNFQNKWNMLGVNYVDRRLDYEIISLSPYRHYNLYDLTKVNETYIKDYYGNYYANLINGNILHINYVQDLIEEGEETDAITFTTNIILDKTPTNISAYNVYGTSITSSNLPSSRYIVFNQKNVNINDYTIHEAIDDLSIAKDMNLKGGEYPIINYISYDGLKYGEYKFDFITYSTTVVDSSDEETNEVKFSTSSDEGDELESNVTYNYNDLSFDNQYTNNGEPCYQITCNGENKISINDNDIKLENGHFINVNNGEYHIYVNSNIKEVVSSTDINELVYYCYKDNTCQQVFNILSNTSNTVLERFCQLKSNGFLNDEYIVTANRGLIHETGELLTGQSITKMYLAIFSEKLNGKDENNTLLMTTKEMYYTPPIYLSVPIINSDFIYVFTTNRTIEKHLNISNINFSDNYFNTVTDKRKLLTMLNNNCISDVVISDIQPLGDINISQNLMNGQEPIKYVLQNCLGTVFNSQISYSNKLKNYFIDNIPYDLYNFAIDNESSSETAWAGMITKYFGSGISLTDYATIKSLIIAEVKNVLNVTGTTKTINIASMYDNELYYSIDSGDVNIYDYNGVFDKGKTYIFYNDQTGNNEIFKIEL